MLLSQLAELNQAIWEEVSKDAREAIYYPKLWRPKRLLTEKEFESISFDLLRGIIDPGVIVRENVGCGSSCGLSLFQDKNGVREHLLSLERRHGKLDLKKEPDLISPNFVREAANRYRDVRPDLTNKELAPLDKYCAFRIETQALQAVLKTNNSGAFKKA